MPAPFEPVELKGSNVQDEYAMSVAIPVVDGEQTISIRAAQTSDLEQIVAVHHKAFGEAFLTRLGPGFLRRYYSTVLQYSGGICVLKEGTGLIEGFVCGFTDPDRFYGTMSRQKWVFAPWVLGAAMRHPFLVPRIVQGIRRVEKHDGGAGVRLCELSSVAVRPEMRGKGLGQSLVASFLRRAWVIGAERVYLETDEDNEAANRLYCKLGFRFRRRFEKSKGRWMNEYAIDLPLEAGA